MTTKRRGKYFPTTDTAELDKALLTFEAAQREYLDFEAIYTAALYRGERPNRMRLDKLEREYRQAAVKAANVMLMQRSVSHADAS